MSVIVAISGGKSSAWCADWALKQYPKEDVILYFNDTKWEHADQGLDRLRQNNSNATSGGYMTTCLGQVRTAKGTWLNGETYIIDFKTMPKEAL